MGGTANVGESPAGYAGRFLRVGLSNGTITEERWDATSLRKWVGGTGVGVKTLHNEVPPSVQWSDPDNRLIMATGPLGGTSVMGTGTVSFVTKGAMTGGATTTQANGFMGAYMKFAGFDAVIVQGQSPKWVYLYLHDGLAELRDAAQLVGTDTYELQDRINEELGKREHRLSVFGIGPAGEHLVRFACIAGDRGHVAGHNGSGAVMGSKRLKAIVAERGKRFPVFDEKGFTNEPSRCRECRAAHKAGRGGSRSGGGTSNDQLDRRRRELYPTVCAQCGKETEMPFLPRDDRPVYCPECFKALRRREGRW